MEVAIPLSRSFYLASFPGKSISSLGGRFGYGTTLLDTCHAGFEGIEMKVEFILKSEIPVSLVELEFLSS